MMQFLTYLILIEKDFGTVVIDISEIQLHEMLKDLAMIFTTYSNKIVSDING